MSRYLFDRDIIPPLWHNGPAPGQIYNFPAKTEPVEFIERSKAPVTTATSLVAVAFDKGVLIAGDLLASYGSLARYKNCPRIVKINDNILFGAGGDYADFQHMKEIIQQKIIQEECMDDGFTLKPKSLLCWLTRVMYNRRNKMDPLWNNFIVGGIENDCPYLATVDKLGLSFEDKVICTGFGGYLALPILRETIGSLDGDGLNESKARRIVAKSMEVLFYRDARSYPKYLMGIITDKGVNVEGPIEVHENWNVATMVKCE